jgi:hypothetical protein
MQISYGDIQSQEVKQDRGLQKGLQLWKIRMLRWILIVLGKLLENINISAKESLGYYELKKHTT